MSEAGGLPAHAGAMDSGVPDDDRPIRIGYFASLLHDRMADALVAFGLDWPDVVVGVEEMGLAELPSAAAGGRVTIAIHPGAAAPGALGCTLWYDHAFVVLPPDHRLASVPEVTPAMLVGEVLLTCRERSHAALHRFLSDRLFAAAPPPARIVPDRVGRSLADHVADGHGVMLTCRSQAESFRPALLALPVTPPDGLFAINASWSARGIGHAADALLARLRG